MTERKRRKLGEIDQEISVCKANLSLSEGKIIGSLARSGSTADSRLSTPAREGSSSDEVVLFIKHLTKLRDTLEEKNALLESENGSSVAVLEGEVARLGGEARRAQEWEAEARLLRERVGELERRLQERLAEGNAELDHYREENTQVKQENRSLRADNKVIMAHLDRL